MPHVSTQLSLRNDLDYRCIAVRNIPQNFTIELQNFATEFHILSINHIDRCTISIVSISTYIVVEEPEIPFYLHLPHPVPTGQRRKTSPSPHAFNPLPLLQLPKLSGTGLVKTLHRCFQNGTVHLRWESSVTEKKKLCVSLLRMCFEIHNSQRGFCLSIPGAVHTCSI